MTDSAPGQLTRQQLYDKIRDASKDAVILEEMQRLGFWPKDKNSPDVAVQMVNRINELEGELRELMQQHFRLRDPEKALKDMRKERMAAALMRRAETKQKHEDERVQRALRWAERKRHEILYLGEGVSKGLQSKQSNATQLAKFGLVDYSDAKTLAQAMGISLPELRFLSYNRLSSRVHHYRRFEIPKKTGGTRLISTPMPRLKKAQHWILANILNKVPVHPAAHGFVPERSILTNATPHVGSALVINMDLQNFFPTITYARVKGYLQKLGYSAHVATMLGLLLTESEVDEIELDNDSYYVKNGNRRLPQGAPTSPMLSNLLCFRFDRRLQGAAKKLGFIYTRYADDLTFSTTTLDDKRLKQLFWRVHQIIVNEGFIVHPDKTRIMRKGCKQEVTGIVVNHKPSLDRKTLRQFKACLQQAKLDGIEGKRWGTSNNFMSAIFGFANYIRMVDPKKGEKYLATVKEIAAKYQPKIKPIPKPQKPKNTQDTTPAPTAEKKKRKSVGVLIPMTIFLNVVLAVVALRAGLPIVSGAAILGAVLMFLFMRKR